MQTKEINIEALDAVLTAVLGRDASLAVAQAYQFTDDVMFKAHCDGFSDGWAAGFEHGKEIGRADQAMDDEMFEIANEEEAFEAFDDEVETTMRENAVPARFEGQGGYPLYDAVRGFSIINGLAEDNDDAVRIANDFWAYWTSRPFIARD
jgi:hypothetical protein